MRKKLWGIVPMWALAVVLVLSIAGSALAYVLTTRDVPVTIQEPITVNPATIQPFTLYPGQGAEFTVTNAADVAYGMQYTYTLGDPDSGILVKLRVDKDGPGTGADYASYTAGTTVNIESNGAHFLKAFCTEESAPVSGVVTIAFNRKAPTT
jgi:hypothetical protein